MRRVPPADADGWNDKRPGAFGNDGELAFALACRQIATVFVLRAGLVGIDICAVDLRQCELWQLFKAETIGLQTQRQRQRLADLRSSVRIDTLRRQCDGARWQPRIRASVCRTRTHIQRDRIGMCAHVMAAREETVRVVSIHRMAAEHDRRQRYRAALFCLDDVTPFQHAIAASADVGCEIAVLPAYFSDDQTGRLRIIQRTVDEIDGKV